MKIASVETWPVRVPLTRPYTIAFETFEAVEMMAVRLVAGDGTSGLGAATPEATVTGETFDACQSALSPASVGWLVGADVDAPARVLHELGVRLPATPAARAALDMALWDLWAKARGRPLVDLLGRAHDALPTSITIGIKGVEETLAEAEEYMGRGFRVLKIKLGASLEEDVARLRRLRERWPGAALRADVNTGYDLDQLRRYLAAVEPLGIEFTEQPLPAADLAQVASLPPGARARIAADESLLCEGDALRLCGGGPLCGVFNIKLMKCGGVRPALGIARIAEAAGVALMWGCMDESVIGVAAALHAALACPATRYLDLDGSLDLARDLGEGGFTIEEGVMRTTGAPGLGVALSE